LILYLDASALVKRYLAEEGSQLVRDLMREADGWAMCRIGYVETVRAITLAAGRRAARRIDDEWSAIDVIEVDDALVRDAAGLATSHDLRSLDALHLAAARLLRRPELLLATWDVRLHAAAIATGLRAVPERLA
jgi:hypothetical protein